MASPPVNFTATERHDIYPAVSPLHALAGSAKGVRVLISGAGRGVGRSIAIAFAQAGAKKIVITSRSLKELEEVKARLGEAGSAEVVLVVASITQEKDVETLFDQAGEIDVLVNNAGALEPCQPLGESSIDSWWNTWEVNIKGTYLPTRELLRRAEKSGRGKEIESPLTIINTSSIGAVGTRPGFSGYQTTKSAINRFTEFLHFEYPKTVRTFAYHPGGVPTLLALGMPPSTHSLLIDTPELAAGFVLWLTTQVPTVDFLRGKYSSANWDVDQLLERKNEIVEKGWLWTRVLGQESLTV